jgi:hypothetical protein
MNAVFQPVEAEFEPLSEARVESVVAIEELAYDSCWGTSLP